MEEWADTAAMKILVLYSYPPLPGGLATQGDLLVRGLVDIGVDARAADLRSNLEKEWYYRWYKPDVVIGVGYWGDVPDIVLHPRSFGIRSVPWILAVDTWRTIAIYSTSCP